MDVRLTWTDCDGAGEYVVPTVFSPRDLVSRPDNMDETVLSSFGHGGDHGHVTLSKYTNFSSRFPWMLHRKFGFELIMRYWRRSLNMLDDDDIDARGCLYYKITL